jgi:tetratricopeptide (TPR) repeat protein
MIRLCLKAMPVLVSMLVIWTVAVPAQVDQGKIDKMLVESYDLLEAGKLDQAKAIFQEILRLDPGNPLALNNLGALMVKEKKYREALGYLEQALPRAQGRRVRVNRVCDAEGICMAFRPSMEVYGDTPFAPLVRLNIAMVKGKLAAEKK